MKKVWHFDMSSLLISVAITLCFGLQYTQLFPFIGYSPNFNYEIISTHVSTQIFVIEPFSYPLGKIEKLTFPYQDANIGNVGGIPLFAIAQKLLGLIFPIAKEIWLYPIINLCSAFVLSFYVQKTLKILGVSEIKFLLFGAIFVTLSPSFLIKSFELQAYCVVAFAIYAIWIFCSLRLLENPNIFGSVYKFSAIFPIAAMADAYALVGISLGSVVLSMVFLLRYIFGIEYRLKPVILICISTSSGFLLAIMSFAIIGLPTEADIFNFNSYDFGIGGRYHVADLFSFFVPFVDSNFNYPGDALLANLTGHFNTDLFGSGQYEGVAFVGSVPLVLLCGACVSGLLGIAFSNTNQRYKPSLFTEQIKLMIWPCSFVLIYSLGYELHILGVGYPAFNLMPAALLSDNFSQLYNIRAPGRLIALPFIFLILVLTLWLYTVKKWTCKFVESGNRKWWLAVCILSFIHIYEISPFLMPLSKPRHTVFVDDDIRQIKHLASDSKAILFASSVKAQATDWTEKAYWFTYFSGKPSNIYYIARPVFAHERASYKTYTKLAKGHFDDIYSIFGSDVLIVSRSELQNIQVKDISKLEMRLIGDLFIYKYR